MVNCKSDSVLNGFCSQHYKESKKLIREVRADIKNMTPTQRIYLKVEIDLESGCHIHSGVVNSSGYPRISIEGVRVAAYIYIFERATGIAMEEGFNLHHTCENKRCVNPEHLRKITIEEHRALHPMERCPITGRLVGKLKAHSH